MRQLHRWEELKEQGWTREALRWAARQKRLRRICRGVYGEGPNDPSDLDEARAAVLMSGAIASGRVSGVLRGLDSVCLDGRVGATTLAGSNRHRRGVRRRQVVAIDNEIVGGVPCTDLVQTIVDLANEMTDLTWEQALESALREGAPLSAVEEAAGTSVKGVRRMRRVLALRPPGAPPTESLLETLMVQLIRTIPDVPPPVRQFKVYDQHGDFVARVDLCWPDLGIFIELDGQHHAGQPVYDARRETAIVAATGWLVARFTWREVRHNPTATARRLAAIISQARLRPLP
ncbi:MAG TPA: DUF559 domain-containing protein [Acidimicrobiales bacterium]|nr:DUF559 domain-containing protein [Acidimicrobiales bacterium]